MLTFRRKEDLSEEIVKELRKHIESLSLGFEEIYNEWPVGNFTLKYPSLSIITVGNSEYRPSMTKPIVLNGEIVGTQKKVLRETGFWEFDLQLDLWCKHKNQRTEFLGKLEQTLDPDGISERKAGLNLRMPDYHNSICSYTYVGYEYEASEISSQRREWRANLRVKANSRALRAKTEFIMKTIELDLEIRDTAEELDPQP